MSRRSTLVLVGVVAAVMLLTACNRGQDPTVNASDTSTSSTMSRSAPTSSSPPAAGATSPPVSIAAAGERAYLTAVRVDTKDSGSSRVVFEFDPVLPGYKVDFATRPVTMDGSGEEVMVAGEALMEVTMENASQARFEGEKVVLTYTGPKRVKPTGAGAGVVLEVVEAGDFEGQVHWVVGLRQKDAKVSVSTISGPSRLVLDIAPS